MRLCTIALLGALLLTGSPLAAEPENILVDKFTFTRPKQWHWKAPGESGAMNRFVLPSSQGKNRTDVQFFILSDAESDFRARILGNFDEVKRKSERKVKLGEVSLTYFTVVGTAVARTTKELKPDYQFTGTLLRTEDPDKYVFVRIAGQTAHVEAGLEDFYQMVERAVYESSAQ